MNTQLTEAHVVLPGYQTEKELVALHWEVIVVHLTVAVEMI